MTSKRFGKSLAMASIFLSAMPGLSKADVSMTKHAKHRGTVSFELTSTLRIKGLKMRIDTTQNGDNHVSIYDLGSGKAYKLDSKRKRVIVVDLKSASDDIKGRFFPDKLRRVIKETGNKKEIGGMSCDEYTFDIQAPTAPSLIGILVQHDSGTVCVSQTIPEGVEVTNFVLEAKKRGYMIAMGVFSPSQSAMGSYFFGPQPNVMVLAASCESRLNSHVMEFSAMTEVTNTFTISDIRSDPIPDEDFQIPPDWKQKKESTF